MQQAVQHKGQEQPKRSKSREIADRARFRVRPELEIGLDAAEAQKRITYRIVNDELDALFEQRLFHRDFVQAAQFRRDQVLIGGPARRKNRDEIGAIERMISPPARCQGITTS